MLKNLINFMKGLAMGSADVVPGISGGTIAFITGIYPQLIQSISSISPELVIFFKKNGLKATLQKINFKFLVFLFSGILVSIFSFAHVITYLLTHYPVVTWSFFMGLMIMSIVIMFQEINNIKKRLLLFSLLGFFVALILTSSSSIVITFTPLNTFFVAAVAICAMILPGISGSLLLVLFGYYIPILNAIKSFELNTILIFAFGALFGLISFSKILNFFLTKYKDSTFLFLIGLMIGTLIKLWPWQIENCSLYQFSILEFNQVLPNTYTLLTGQENYVYYSFFSFFCGIFIVYLLNSLKKT
ncbi:DUF368 domain-containing protein [Paraphotobacterium marinum]|uniref:DUF368 domain-containing protein n=1 Tax=Paraphotobacterium marinum TaxID=1755811 RepID=A0A220VHR1_9GAMM|nr:DUF368 domain-containing protein [Paraphotobacterium marinum]ASK79790.1 DUF368 domain-containing protein [Paraphotobacterium marinum]